MFLAAEPFPGFVHAGVRGFSLGGGRRLPPHWNYNYLSCLSNSSASTSRLAGVHTPIGSGEVRGNLTVCMDISQHSEAAHHPVTAKVPLATKAACERKWEGSGVWGINKRWYSGSAACLSAWVWEPFEKRLACPWGTFVSADSLQRFFELTKGHIWWMRVLHASVSLEETYRCLENTEIIRRFSWYFLLVFLFFRISVEGSWAYYSMKPGPGICCFFFLT